MAELGIGVRVRTGWSPERVIQFGMRIDPRLTEGTLVEGPVVEPYLEGTASFWKIETDAGVRFKAKDNYSNGIAA